MIPADLQAALDARGLNLWGALRADDYDTAVPEAWRLEQVAPGSQGALIVGNAGPRLWECFTGSSQAALEDHPLDRYTRAAIDEVRKECPGVASYAFYTERRDGHFLPLLALGQRAGFGRMGRIGILVHPVHGPWVSIRAALYVDAPIDDSDAPTPDLCERCPAPCVEACNGDALGGDGADYAACVRAKLEVDACREACDARAACVVGRGSVFSPEAIAHHSRIRFRR